MPNGFVSLWVRDAVAAHKALQTRPGAKFPVVESINEKAGVDKQDGYTQCLTVDADGNLLLLTEYTGRMTK